MAGRPKRRMERALAAKKIAAAAGEPEPMDLPSAQAILDDRAAEALLLSQGDPRRALEVLGTDVANLRASQIVDRARVRFGRPEVLQRIRASLDDTEKQRKHILRRMVTIARFGEPKAAISAAGYIARVSGWNPPERHEHRSVSFNLHKISENDANFEEFLALTSHEPGEATAVTVEAGDLPTRRDDE